MRVGSTLEAPEFVESAENMGSESDVYPTFIFDGDHNSSNLVYDWFLLDYEFFDLLHFI
jgi:hypothetical protein